MYSSGYEDLAFSSDSFLQIKSIARCPKTADKKPCIFYYFRKISMAGHEFTTGLFLLNTLEGRGRPAVVYQREDVSIKNHELLLDWAAVG